MVDARDNIVMQEFILVPTTGVHLAGVCECTVLSCIGVPVVGEYKRGERGREAPKSLLGEKMIEASANIALRITFVCVSVLRDEEDGRERGGLGRSPPPPFIDTRRGGVHVREISEVVAVGCSGCLLLKVHCGALGSMV